MYLGTGLTYKQRVIGSSPILPTTNKALCNTVLFIYLSLALTYGNAIGLCNNRYSVADAPYEPYTPHHKQSTVLHSAFYLSFVGSHQNIFTHSIFDNIIYLQIIFVLFL